MGMSFKGDGVVALMSLACLALVNLGYLHQLLLVSFEK